MDYQKKSITIVIALALALTILSVACSSSGESDDFKKNDWELVTLSGQPALPEVTVTAFFDGQGGLSGFAGCNSYTGNYGVGGNQLEINAIRDTTNLCDNAIMDQENAFLAALKLSTSFDTGGSPDIATVRDNGGRELMTMKRITP